MSSRHVHPGSCGWAFRAVTTVSYCHEFTYGYDDFGARLPLLRFRLSGIENPLLMVDVDVALDSGAQRSLFDGRIGAALGLDLLRGPRLTFETMAGNLFPATLHTIQLTHNQLGTFKLETAFSTGEIRRNLLGRDFFDLVQIGFREHYLTFYVTPTR